ncbi:MAG: hypothetical protein A3K19_32000 [Lentisphaerae bacterium RIFOXYB12_FULL_65_16]|nr:MAG: hypothetical protein A3K18_10780 [Lentisphaerae bacterium RIFOXYA12_64_32]OGV88725.1 MAG: hypothetical protein A3K19_32000 [Lentisphaerae bacterium RIFOXYB12_FULL_65_16]
MSPVSNLKPPPAPDYFGPPAAVLFVACLALVGFDLYQGIMFRRDLILAMNEAVTLSNNGRPQQALARLTAIQLEWAGRRCSGSEAVLQRFMPFATEAGQRFSVVHRNLATEYAAAQMPDLAVRHYALGLCAYPRAPEVPAEVAQECFRVKNYELGWISTKLAQASGSTVAILPSLLRFFEKHYTGPKYTLPGAAPASAVP